MSRLQIRNALRHITHQIANPTGSKSAERDIFDYWQTDGELGMYPPSNTDTGGFDYWQADGELPAIENKV